MIFRLFRGVEADVDVSCSSVEGEALTAGCTAESSNSIPAVESISGDDETRVTHKLSVGECLSRDPEFGSHCCECVVHSSSEVSGRGTALVMTACEDVFVGAGLS